VPFAYRNNIYLSHHYLSL